MPNNIIPSVPLRAFLQLPPLWACTALYCLIGGALLGFDRSSVENGLIENSQLVALFITILYFGAAARASQGAFRVVCLSAFYLCSMFWLREYKAEPGDTALSFYLGTRAARWHLTFIFAVIGSIWLARGGYRLIPLLTRFGFSLRSWPFVLPCLVLLISEIAEKMHYEWAEETLELVGYCTFIQTAYWCYRMAKTDSR